MCKLTAVEIIDLTVKRIQENGRALRKPEENGCRCKYRTSDGKGCAVGMYIIEDEYSSRFEGNGVEGLDGLLKNHGKPNGIDDVLEKEVRGQNIEFWNKLQSIHDEDTFWDGNRITEDGKRAVKSLKEEYSETTVQSR